MRFKSILLSMAAISLMSAMTSCQNEEEVKMPDTETGINLKGCKTVSLTIASANGLKTRAGETPILSYDEDGLFNFTRTIDKLWYAVYYEGDLLYDSFETEAKQAVYDSQNDSFKLDLLIPMIDDEIKLSNYKVFFFAGNALDKVAMSEISDGIGLDFDNKTLYAYPAVLNASTASGDFFSPSQTDFFAKYVSLDDVVDENFSGTITLTRPFCQVSLLSDEFVHPAVLKTYDSERKVALNTTPAMFTEKNASTQQSLPYGWNYDSDELLVKGISDMTFTIDSKAAYNPDGGLEIPQEIEFKARKMFCVASYLMLAPDARKQYSNDATKEQFSFDLTVNGNLHSTDASVKVNTPTGGLKANEKYVIYNKQFDPKNTDPENPGGTGIVSSHYLLDVVTDPTWEGKSEIGF